MKLLASRGGNARAKETPQQKSWGAEQINPMIRSLIYLENPRVAGSLRLALVFHLVFLGPFDEPQYLW